MRKYYILFISLLISFLSFSQQNKVQTFGKIKFDKITAYNFEGDGENILDEKRQLQKKMIKKERNLSSTQINYLHTNLKDTKNFGGIYAACFNPHLAVVYYLKDKIVGSIDICFECNYFESTFFNSKNSAFSKIGKKNFEKFCEELQFSDCY